jgi:hypothetical protein
MMTSSPNSPRDSTGWGCPDGMTMVTGARAAVAVSSIFPSGSLTIIPCSDSCDEAVQGTARRTPTIRLRVALSFLVCRTERADERSQATSRQADTHIHTPYHITHNTHYCTCARGHCALSLFLSVCHVCVYIYYDRMCVVAYACVCERVRLGVHTHIPSFRRPTSVSRCSRESAIHTRNNKGRHNRKLLE